MKILFNRKMLIFFINCQQIYKKGKLHGEHIFYMKPIVFQWEGSSKIAWPCNNHQQSALERQACYAKVRSLIYRYIELAAEHFDMPVNKVVPLWLINQYFTYLSRSSTKEVRRLTLSLTRPGSQLSEQRFDSTLLSKQFIVHIAPSVC